MATSVEEIQLETASEVTTQQEREINERNSASRENLVSDLAPIDRGRQAWTFLASSFVFEVIIWGQSNAYGAFQNYHDHDPRSGLYHRASPAATSAIGTLAIAGQHFVPLLTRGFFNSYPHLIKITCQTCIALSTLSLLAASFLETQASGLLIFQGILYGILSGVSFSPVILWLPQWFDKRRGTAIGIIYSASGLGGTVFPLLFGSMLNKFGFSWTLRIMALYSFAATSAAAYVMQPRLPILRPAVNDDRPILRKLVPQGLKAMFGMYASASEAAVVCQTVAWCTISLQIATFTTSLGFSTTLATAVLSAFNASATFGYLFIGRLVDVTPYPYIMAISTLLCSLAAFLLLGFTHSLPLLLTFVLVFGLLGGGFPTFLTPISTDLAKLHNQDSSTINMASIFLRGVAAVCGPLLGSALYQQNQSSTSSSYGTNGIKNLTLYVGTAMAMSFVLAVIASKLRKNVV